MFQKGNSLSPGRPKSIATIAGERMRNALAVMVEKEFKPIVLGQIDAAKGIVVEEEVTLKDGTKVPRYYKRAPDGQAVKLLIEHSIGRPKEQIDLKANVSIIELVMNLEVENKKQDGE